MKKRFGTHSAVLLLSVMIGGFAAFQLTAAAGQTTQAIQEIKDEHVSSAAAIDSVYDYPAFPTAARVMADIGFAPKMTEQLTDAYTFRRGYIDRSTGVALVLEYTSPQLTENQTIRLFADAGEMKIEGGTRLDNGAGPALVYYEDENQEQFMQRLIWQEGNLNYILAVNNCRLSEESLKAMASGVINAK